MDPPRLPINGGLLHIRLHRRRHRSNSCYPRRGGPPPPWDDEDEDKNDTEVKT
uniref:Uncharacterized protein n=1 Tax=Arundo donax TaxID=35708 RepID=A0A0A9D597_ARUDO